MSHTASLRQWWLCLESNSVQILKAQSQPWKSPKTERPNCTELLKFLSSFCLLLAMVQLDVCLLRNEVATQKERENCQGDRDRLQKLVHHFLWDAMVTAGRVFPMWAVRHLFWHTQPKRAVSGHVRLAVYARAHNCRVETTELYMLSHSLSPHRKHALFTWFPTFFPCYLFIKSHNSGSFSEFLDLLYLLTSFMFIFCLAFSPPLLLSLFFFELHSAYSRAYNLTPPSSLTLSLHPLAKLPFRSRGNPLISQTQLPRLHLGWGWGGDAVWRGGASWDTKPFKWLWTLFLQTLHVFPALSVWGLGKRWGRQWLVLILRFSGNDVMVFIHMRGQWWRGGR